MAKILLIEDHDMNRDMLTRRLRRKGYEVVEAINGRQGIDMAAGEAPAVILMDMSLPEIDGWEATRILKARDDTRNIPIIGLSAHAMSGDRQKGLAAGCDDYDTKPIDFPRLLDKINKFLANS
ncbi:MAG: response regulator [Acidobacteriota bacterium]|nr:response regulator [Acidobacteriota bacterium]